jgi:hypothetical protein
MAFPDIHPLKWAAALLALACATGARGSMEWEWYLTANPDSVIGQTTIVNDNNGAVYDSYQVKLADLANQIYSNNPALHGTYSSGADLVADGVFTYGINSKPTSEVANGWQFETQIQTNGDVRLSNVGGIPGLDYDMWYATTQNASQDMQRGTLSVRKTFLDLDGDGWTTNDLRIGNDTNQIVAGGVGREAGMGGLSFTDTISRIVMILPEREVSISSTHAWFGENAVGNPSGAGAYKYGSAVTVSVDRIAVDPENLGRRLRIDPPGEGDRAEVVIPFLSNSTTVAFAWTNQYLYGVYANSSGGTIEGTASGWQDGGTVVSNWAVPYRRCAFLGWENVPAGLEGNPELTFALEDAWTNATALFAIPFEPLQLRPGAGPPPAFEVQAWFTARVQRCAGSLTNGDWRDVGTMLPFGTTNWNDATATGEWVELYYRLAQ